MALLNVVDVPTWAMPKSGAMTIIRQRAPFRNAVGPSCFRIFLNRTREYQTMVQNSRNRTLALQTFLLKRRWRFFLTHKRTMYWSNKLTFNMTHLYCISNNIWPVIFNIIAQLLLHTSSETKRLISAYSNKKKFCIWVKLNCRIKKTRTKLVFILT